MKIKLITILLIVFYLISCKTEREEKFKKSICGEWIFVRVGTDNEERKVEKKQGRKTIELPPPPPIFENLNFRKGYIFYSNNSCEDKRGYFKQIDGKSREDKKILFLGNDTKYKVEDDSLKIFDLADSTWKGIKIRSITSDTLTLEVDDTVFFKYAKTHYRIDKAQTFDMILVSSSACNGTCPISNTSIDKYGNFIFYGQGYNTKTGLFISKINQDYYHRIELNFKKANIDKLDNNYSANWTDDQTITITFIKDNKIYKTISDYGHKAPRELYWAYTPVSFLYQKLDLKPFKVNTKEPLSISPACFENKGLICELERSERFYLSIELYRSREVKHVFEKKYILRYWDEKDNQKEIITDGRHYQFREKNKDITLDLGYNFLDRNNLYNKFRQKNKYD